MDLPPKRLRELATAIGLTIKAQLGRPPDREFEPLAIFEVFGQERTKGTRHSCRGRRNSVLHLSPRLEDHARHLVRRNRERGRVLLKPVRSRILRRLPEIIAETPRAARPLLGFALVAFRDVAKPLLVIVRERRNFHAVRGREFLRLRKPLLELLARVDVRVREKHRNLASHLLETRHAGAGAGAAADMEKRRHDCIRCCPASTGRTTPVTDSAVRRYDTAAATSSAVGRRPRSVAAAFS